MTSALLALSANDILLSRFVAYCSSSVVVNVFLMVLTLTVELCARYSRIMSQVLLPDVSAFII
jgi:hypothetical protein